MRTLAIGDIHGFWGALAALAQAVPFTDDDLIVTLGDHVDRGPESRAVLDWLLERSGAGRLLALRGNHEEVMLQARRDPDRLKAWLAFGGEATLASYAQKDGNISNVPAEHWDFLKHGCHDYFETGTHIFVHGNAQPDLPLEEQPTQTLLWEKFRDPLPHCSGKIMVCGHTPQKSGLPVDLGHAICIDTWVYGPGWLTCLDVEARYYWQARQSGEIRSGHLDELG